MTQPSDIAFSQVREDPLVDERVVSRVAERLGRPIRVLMIASGGCTALSLLGLDAIESIVAVDANPAQIHLVELRRAAMALLSTAEQRRFLGADPCDASERRAAHDRLRAQLPEATRAHWDAREREIATGVLHVGRFEALFRELASALRDAGLDPLERPAEAVASAAWRSVFERVFDRAGLIDRFGPAAVEYSMDRSFGEHFAAVFASALARWPEGASYFLHQALESRYVDGPGGSPPCLEPSGHAAACARGLDRLSLRARRFDDALRDPEGGAPFDLIHTSNISDWMPVPELRAMTARVRDLLVPGGAMLGRRLNGDHCLADVVGTVLDVERVISQELRASDRSFFYAEVVLGERA